jgi:hypothetical protein
MSLTRLNYDACTYDHNLKQSTSTSDYMIGAPRVDCVACFQKDPKLRFGSGYAGGSGGKYGGSVCDNDKLIDVSSELLNISRKASNCPNDKYKPYKNVCNAVNIIDCKAINSEDSRFSNPPCTLKGTGWNRWEWLCKNPQDKALMTFDYNISNRIIVKDNHRPCIPNLINQSDALPMNNNKDDMVSFASLFEDGIKDDAPPSISWRTKEDYAKYF